MRLAIVAIAIMVNMPAVITGHANIAIPTLAQNATSWNKTSGNSTEGLTTSEERGAYSDYGLPILF
jgi:hypothetical protein